MSPTRSPRRRSLRRHAGPTLGLSLLTVLGAAAAPAVAAAHQLTGRFTSPIPLGAYLAGAALAVGVSFAVVFLRGGLPAPSVRTTDERIIRVPRWLRGTLVGLGLFAWLWVVVQAVIIAGRSEGDTASLFLWTYGWVGLALVSAFVGPAWTWLDPFASLHRLLAAVLGRLGLAGGVPAEYPERLGRWPAVLGFGVFVWLELAMPGARSGRGLGLVLVAYTVVTLVAMAQFGRETWRRNGEVFSVWFALVGRLAPLAPVREPGATDQPGRPARLRVRRFAFGLLEPGTDLASLVLIALSVGGILFDGLSQTQIYFDWFGVPSVPEQTVLLVGWLAIVVFLAMVVGRLVGTGPLVAGLVPIAIGYLIAHYLTFVLFDSQRILLSLTDPLGLGWDLLGIGEFEPATGWLPGGVAWSLQLVAVVGGHVVGAWAGHSVALREASGPDGVVPASSIGAVRRRQVPLALLMVGLTSLTLWSLGQAIVQTTEEGGTASMVPAAFVVPAASVVPAAGSIATAGSVETAGSVATAAGAPVSR